MIVLLKNQIIPLLYGEKYIYSLKAVNILLMFWLFQSINWTLGGYAGLKEKTYIPLLCNSVGLVSDVFLNYILIPKLGLVGAAAASTFSSALILLIMLGWIY